TTGMGSVTLPRAAGAIPASPPEHQAVGTRAVSSDKAFRLRMCFQDVPLHYWYRKGSGLPDERKFWDKQGWEKFFKDRMEDGYNAIVYGPFFPQWQAYLIRHKQFPEARELPPSVLEPIIEQVNWIFRAAHENGIQNFLMYYHIVTSPAFAKAHGID